MSNITARKPMFSVHSPAPLVSQLVTLKSRLLRLIMAALLTLAALLSNPARAEWREASSPHFVVVSGGSERELVRMSQRLEAVHWMMTLLTGVTPQGSPQKVRIYLVDGIGDVHRAMGVTNNSAAAGFYRTDPTGAIAVVPRSEGNFSTTILFHEYAHHFMLQYLDATYPPWFVEGFAEFVSTASFEREGSIHIGKAARHREEEASAVAWVDVSRMFAPRSEDDDEAGVASYWQYWVAAHYLLLNPERRVQLNRFMNAVNRGVPFEEAYGEFEGGLAQLNRDMRLYSRQRSFDGRLAPLPADVMAAPQVRLLRAGEVAVLDLELQAGRNLDEAERARLSQQIDMVAARHPDDAAVAALQTRILFEAKNWAGAEAAAARALALDPANSRVAAWRGWAMVSAMADGDEAVPLARVSPARAIIFRAMQADPGDPVPRIAFYRSFALVDQRPPPSALTAIVEAARLVPQEGDVRMTAALAQLSSRNLPVARRLLRPLAFAPHRSAQQGYALQLVQWIDAGGETDMPVYQPPAEEESDD